MCDHSDAENIAAEALAGFNDMMILEANANASPVTATAAAATASAKTMATAPPTPGDFLSNGVYELPSRIEIGRGYSAVVYRCVDNRIGQTYTEKVFFEKRQRDGSAEAEVLQALAISSAENNDTVTRMGRAHVPRFRDFLSAQCSVRYDYVDGLPLSAYAECTSVSSSSSRSKSKPTLSLDERVRVLQQVAAALAFLHANNYVHRDVKPDNVLYNPATQHATLIDFGFAEQVSLPSMPYFNASRLRGTPLFAPPFILYSLCRAVARERGDSRCGVPSRANVDNAPTLYRRHPYMKAIDVWAFATLAYLLVYERMPYPATSYLHNDVCLFADAVGAVNVDFATGAPPSTHTAGRSVVDILQFILVPRSEDFVKVRMDSVAHVLRKE